MKYLFTGGSGLLGTEMKKHFPDALFPTRQELDYTRDWDCFVELTEMDFDVLVHMGAYTATVGCETKINKALTNNIQGTCNLARACDAMKKKMVYISTDYVFDGNNGPYSANSPMKPFNNYGWSKLGGECAVHMLSEHLIIRTSFCSNEFPYDKAFIDQMTTRMPVKEASLKISEVIKLNPSGVVHVYGEQQTVYTLARKLSPEKDIRGISIHDMEGYNLPSDTRLRK